MKRYLAICFLVSLLASKTSAQSSIGTIISPDQKLQADVLINAKGELTYSVKRLNETVIAPSALGISIADEVFAELKLVSVTKSYPVNQTYQMSNAKKALMTYRANKKTFVFKNAHNRKFELVFQVSNDAVAFRYGYPDFKQQQGEINKELTAFNFPPKTKSWLQPMQVSKSGWEQTNPAYEEHYNANVDVSAVKASAVGWVYPALFKVANNYVLLTEAGLDSNYCATRLISTAMPGNFVVGFPDEREKLPGKKTRPQLNGIYESPWRVITVGNLATVFESTAGTDLAKPAKLTNIDFVKPGKASWSWINSKDDFIIYSEQKKYIDFASAMNWQYCLIDADWDRKIGYEQIKELAAYASSKNVGLLLWYNSAGDWNTVKYTPKNLLLTAAGRKSEFSKLKQMGIKGIKVDFFGGDGQSVIKYYIDILTDAAQYELMVNFHGATLPRGWARTYPNLLTTEAVRGFENVTFNQKDADREAEICTILPFSRNVFDPMDYTPMNLYKIPTHVKRKTTSAFQLALAVVFLSGIQHFAESPEGMQKVNDKVKGFLRELPVKWDEVKLLEGSPGEYLAVARRAGSKWYIAGITNKDAYTFELDLEPFGYKSALLYVDSKELPLTIEANDLDLKQGKTIRIPVLPEAGFVIEIH